MSRDHLMGYTGHLRALHGDEFAPKMTARLAPRPPVDEATARQNKEHDKAVSQFLSEGHTIEQAEKKAWVRVRAKKDFGRATEWRGELVLTHSEIKEKVDQATGRAVRTLVGKIEKLNCVNKISNEGTNSVADTFKNGDKVNLSAWPQGSSLISGCNSERVKNYARGLGANVLIEDDVESPSNGEIKVTVRTDARKLLPYQETAMQAFLREKKAHIEEMTKGYGAAPKKRYALNGEVVTDPDYEGQTYFLGEYQALLEKAIRCAKETCRRVRAYSPAEEHRLIVKVLGGMEFSKCSIATLETFMRAARAYLYESYDIKLGLKYRLHSETALPPHYNQSSKDEVKVNLHGLKAESHTVGTKLTKSEYEKAHEELVKHMRHVFRALYSQSPSDARELTHSHFRGVKPRNATVFQLEQYLRKTDCWFFNRNIPVPKTPYLLHAETALSDEEADF